jgi:predicted permease
MIHELRHAVRALRRSPAFAATSILTLALGIGASTAVFSVVNVVFFRPLPFAHEHRLVRLRDFLRAADGSLEESNTSAVSFEAIRTQNRVFEAIAAFTYGSATAPGAEAPERLSVVGTTAPLGSTLGVRTVIGRDLTDRELVLGRDSRVALVSSALWERRFGSKAVAEAVLPLDGVPHAVVGVLSPGFHFPYDADVWVPARLAPGDEPAVFARLLPGVSLARANSDLATIAARLVARAQKGRGFGMSAMPARRSLIGDEHRVALGLLVLVGALLLLTGADVASLLLARSLSRRGEHAIRAALGASRARLAAPVAAEAAVLALCAAAAGLVVSLALQGPLSTLVPDNLRHQLGLARPSLDFRTLAFALAAAAVAGVLCAAAPVWKGSRDAPGPALRESGRAFGLSRREGRVLGVLVAAEVALAMALLCGAGSFALHLGREERRELGLRTEGALAMQLALPQRFSEGTPRSNAVDAILREIRAVPGVARAGATTVNPLSGGTWVVPIEVEGAAAPDPAFRFLANYRVITPELLAALGAQRVEGRDFEPRDGQAAPPVALVSRSLARRFWPGAPTIGRRLRIAASRQAAWATVVGVVGDVADAGDVKDTWYVPYAQNAAAAGTEEVHVMVRAAGGVSAASLAAPVRRAIARVDPSLSAYAVATLSQVRREVLARDRLGSLLIALLAAFGTLIAVLGTYGVASYRMERRRRDIGLRIVLGARPARALRETLREGLSPVVAGIGGGALLSLLEAAGLPRAVPGLEKLPAALAAAIGAGLFAAALAGTLAPALRLSRMDPGEVLKEG